MRVIYLYKCGYTQKSGVEKKIFNQIESLKNHGIDSLLYSICVENKIKVVENKNFNYSIGILNKIWRESKNNLQIKKIIVSLSSIDIAYLRIPYPSSQLTRILRHPRACKIVIEYQTIEPLEYQLKGKYWYLLIDFLFGDAIRKYTDAIVGVTDEITQYQLSRAGDPNKPHITIGNGFDVASAPIRHPPTYNTTRLHLLCVANVSRWHGLDRLLRGIAAYSGTPDVMLHIAGDGSELPRLQKLTNELGIGDRVLFHGFTTGKDLDDLFNTCHIAVGSLGIHKKGLAQTSELKVREYCARGIPWIIACKDPDFPEDFPYIHRIPADESPVNLDEVIGFAKKACSDPDHPVKMRSYAVEHLDWSVKMKKLKTFLESLVDESPSISE